MSKGGALRVVLGFLVCVGIVRWDQSDGDADLPFMGASCIALTLVFGGYGLFWYIRYRARGRE